MFSHNQMTNTLKDGSLYMGDIIENIFV